jgi:predicted MFS family arabinose efflux permease
MSNISVWKRIFPFTNEWFANNKNSITTTTTINNIDDHKITTTKSTDGGFNSMPDEIITIDNNNNVPSTITSQQSFNFNNIDQQAQPTNNNSSCCSKECRLSLRSKFKACLRDPNTYPLGMLCLLFAGINADQNLISPQLTVIATEFNMTAEERDERIGGWLSVGFFIVGGICTLLVGYYTDRIRHRVMLLCALVLVGEFACFCTLFVTDFWSFFVTRAITGISVGGSQPLIYSMVGDMFVDRDRGKASSVIAIAYGGGIFLGQTLSSSIGPALGWRIPFAILAALTIALLPVIALTVKDPSRGSKERVTPKKKYKAGEANWSKYKQILATPTVVLVWLQGIPGSISWGAMLTYFQDFLVQDIAKDKISIQESSVVVLCFATGEAIGTVVGGLIADYLWLRDLRWLPVFIGSTSILATFPIYGLINAPVMDLYAYCLLCLPSGFLIVIGGSALKALLLNTTLPEVRGQAWR